MTHSRFLRTSVALGLALLAWAAPLAAEEAPPRRERVLTQAEQEALTPQQVLTALESGNERFVAGAVTKRDHSKLVRDAVNGQYPKAVILSCLDSRIPVEDVFDRGLGDIFVARVAGNFVNTDILGSMEFACKVAGAKAIVVLGHTKCGAIMGACDNVQLGNLTSMLSNLMPAVKAIPAPAGGPSSQNVAFVQQVADKNVELTIEAIKKQSPVLNEMLENGEIAIVGAMYDVETGKVSFQ